MADQDKDQDQRAAAATATAAATTLAAPAGPEKMVRVDMKRSAGIRGAGESAATLYGPGENILVPERLAKALNLAPKPELEGGTTTSTTTASGTAAATGAGTAGTGSTSATGGDDELPEDFPAREQLAGEGLTTRSAVSAKSDEELDAIEGIGPATVEKIRSALKGTGK